MVKRSSGLSLLFVLLTIGFPTVSRAGIWELVKQDSPIRDGGLLLWRLYSPKFHFSPIGGDEIELDQSFSARLERFEAEQKRREDAKETLDVSMRDVFVPKLPVSVAHGKLPKAFSLKFLDGGIQPIALVRTLGVYTQEDKRTVVLDRINPVTGENEILELDTTKMDPSLFGHRQGFVLENAEIGIKGRVKSAGMYYQLKAELIPREKDGNRSSDYLKDAFVGFDMFSWVDLRVGRMTIPFSQANMKSTEAMHFIYAPTLNTLSSKRQLGAMITAGDPWQVLMFRWGVFNSTGLAVEQIKRSAQLLNVARAEIHWDRILAAIGRSAADLELVTSFNVAYTDEEFDTQAEHRWIGADAHFHLYLFTIDGEFIVKDFYTAPPGNESRSADRGIGWHVDLTVEAIPRILDLNVRYEEMDGDDPVRGESSTMSIDELSRQKKRWITAGVSLHLMDQVRLEFNYIHRDELEGYKFDNDVFLTMLQFAL